MEPARDRLARRRASTSRTARRCCRASPATCTKRWRRSWRSDRRISPTNRRRQEHADALEGRVALSPEAAGGSARRSRSGSPKTAPTSRSTTAATRTPRRETVAEIEKLGRSAAARTPRRSTTTRSARRWSQQALGDLGDVDILVNNAGVASRGQTVADTDPAEIERLLRTHAFGAWACSKLVLPSMRDAAARRHRHDLERGDACTWRANSAPYNMAKAALEALASTLAKEERRNGIHVNIVAPGLVDTEMGRRLVKGAMGVEDIRTMDKAQRVRPRVHTRGGRRRRALRRVRRRRRTSPASASASTAAPSRACTHRGCESRCTQDQTTNRARRDVHARLRRSVRGPVRDGAAAAWRRSCARASSGRRLCTSGDHAGRRRRAAPTSGPKILRFNAVGERGIAVRAPGTPR